MTALWLPDPSTASALTVTLLLIWTLAGLAVGVPTPPAGSGVDPSVVYQIVEPLSDEIVIDDPISTVEPLLGSNVGSGGGVVSFTSHMP